MIDLLLGGRSLAATGPDRPLFKSQCDMLSHSLATVWARYTFVTTPPTPDKFPPLRPI